MIAFPDLLITVYTGVSDAIRSASCLTVPSSKLIGADVDGGSTKLKSPVLNATWQLRTVQANETWQVLDGMGNRRCGRHVYRNAGLHALSHGRQGLIVV